MTEEVIYKFDKPPLNISIHLDSILNMSESKVIFYFQDEQIEFSREDFIFILKFLKKIGHDKSTIGTM